jgi:predicted AAA+ superfamily ATPase
MIIILHNESMAPHYLPRTIEKSLLRAAREAPVVALTGPRQTGKSTLLRRIFPKHRYVTFDDTAIRLEALNDPTLFLESRPGPLLLDEIQYVPSLLSQIKMEVDRNPGVHGRFILTGSQAFTLMAGLSESLAGRVYPFELLGFSWEELAPGKPVGWESCWKAIHRGFYPVPALRKVDVHEYYAAYVSTYIERDVRLLRGVQDLGQFRTFVGLLAARSASVLHPAEVGRDCGINHVTARSWISILEATRLGYLLRPFHRNLSKRLVKSSKFYLTDTGLLSHLLKYPDWKTLASGPMAGAFFETMVIGEVLKRLQGGRLLVEPYFFRDSNGLEADLILDFGRKQVAVEIKATMTPRFEHTKPLASVMKVLGCKQGWVLHGGAGEHTLAPGIRAIPWWKMSEMF